MMASAHESSPPGTPSSLTSDQIQVAQLRRKRVLELLAVVLVAPLLFVDSYWRARWHGFYESIEYAGAALIVVCMFGRTWCTLYIGGRKKEDLVTAGPYSLMRNPLYTFTLIGVAGIGAQSGSLLIALALTCIVYAVFRNLTLQEEVFLTAHFGDSYRAYVARTPRFLPRLSGWRDIDQITVGTRLLYRTFLDATLLLLAIPAADLLEYLQQAGVLPVIAHLP